MKTYLYILAAIALMGGLATAEAPMLSFSATTENVAGAPDPVRIDLLRWSTDAERDQLVAAWNKTGAPGRGGAGRGGGRGGRGGRGGGGEDAPPTTPEGMLAAALEKAGTVGYVWSSEVAGYAIRYAAKLTLPNGGERIILITNRRLGIANDLWKPVGAGTPSAYDFSVIELRVNAKGEGEGKASLTGKVVPDSAAKVVALEDYNALPVVLKNVRRK